MPPPGSEEAAVQLYHKLQTMIQRDISWRWAQARRLRRQDAGAAMKRFKRLWITPGLAVPAADESSVTLTLFMCNATRQRWHRTPPARQPGERRTRNQQYAPPAQLPSNAIELYVMSAAGHRKKGEPDPPAG